MYFTQTYIHWYSFSVFVKLHAHFFYLFLGWFWLEFFSSSSLSHFQNVNFNWMYYYYSMHIFRMSPLSLLVFSVSTISLILYTQIDFDRNIYSTHLSVYYTHIRIDICILLYCLQEMGCGVCSVMQLFYYF